MCICIVHTLGSGFAHTHVLTERGRFWNLRKIPKGQAGTLPGHEPVGNSLVE